ncbi:uncharacterized protein LOC115214408 [Octopus sinensis]|uniref:Uncharacterized protein LOC115214408 n=1 Tax=Octopus sinensis TaxID=2607531 RepID=A0A6P7SN33_9MOLL|nr:uncharacterized protein LOC115214408 [Octopus sinensis]
MAAPAVDFCKIESRAIKLKQGKGAAESHGEMKEILKDGCSSYSIMNIWVLRFRTGHFEVTGEPRSRRPTFATTEDKADAVHVMILEVHRILAKGIAKTLRISRQRAGYIILDILDTRKLSAKWVPKYLIADQKRIRMTT